ncbi:glycosyltransferase family 2 protein [Salegentibacter salegens]|uniref:Glycosyltransferase involved in cell wall bisynthesis n=1 Tax=Salegentibacter salegens TaxID=143223 RepID=A0A1M7NDZ8_9FLAO|nr:glycosyltransferase family 2 protein [Salegentibacter salegens]PRX41539.1 glycosyltransferase involved in cell wall biosynthesis [Salegentibacter salegens]SHN01880.1 Glycosyltransferase involved in cell wall bisynthesis [Salegentibacter salegens]
MNYSPKVTVILPNFNHSQFLEQRLETIFNQTFQDFEVILLDDASSDNSLSILEKYKENSKVSHFVINERNLGSPFKQWQKGISLAKGEYIWIAESDDYCELEFLEKIFQLKSSSRKDLGLIYCQSVDVDENGNSIKSRINYTSNFVLNIWKNDFSLYGRKFIETYLKTKNVIPNASAVVFKKSLVKDSFFSIRMLNMKMCGDWLFWCQILPNTNVGFLAQNLNYFRNHTTVTRNHKTRDLKKRRLIEESYIRKKLCKKAILQSQEKNKLYQSWFQLHSFSEIFFFGFYKVVIEKSDYISFLTSFVKFKLNNYRN